MGLPLAIGAGMALFGIGKGIYDSIKAGEHNAKMERLLAAKKPTITSGPGPSAAPAGPSGPAPIPGSGPGISPVATSGPAPLPGPYTPAPIAPQAPPGPAPGMGMGPPPPGAPGLGAQIAGAPPPLGAPFPGRPSFGAAPQNPMPGAQEQDPWLAYGGPAQAVTKFTSAGGPAYANRLFVGGLS